MFVRKEELLATASYIPTWVCYIDDPADPIDSPADVQLADPAEPIDPPADPVDQVDPPADPADPVDPVDPPAAVTKTSDWRDKKIARLSARLKDLQAKPAVTVAQSADADGKISLTQAELDVLIDQRAAVKSTQQTFDQQLLDTVATGRKTYTGFDQSIAQLREVVDFEDKASTASYSTFLQAAVETGSAAALVHALGQDQDEAARILAMPPVKMAVELSKLAVKLESAAGAGAGNPLTRAPKPITPIGGRGAAHTQIDPSDPTRADRLSTKEWMERREAQVAKGQRVN